MIKARTAMKRIQPFTIGTKLSVPSENRCLDYASIMLPVPVLDCCELRNDSSNDDSPFHEDRVSTSTPVEGLSDDIKEGDDRDSVSPPASSRSIKKIAMCANVENQTVTGFNVANCETNKPTTSTEKLFLVEESDKHGAQLETDPWTIGRKIRNLQYDYSMPTFPHDQPEDTSHSQRRDFKDFENSLIQLTTSLDLMQEDPKRPLQKKTDAVDLGLEMFRRRQSPGDHADKSWLKLRSLLRDYHQDLMLALDVSSFYQQADSIIGTINSERSRVLAGDIQKSDKETREIACQINMLNESACCLSTLHPTLAKRVTCKQAEVKENWALLQDFLRNQKTDVSPKCPSVLPADPLTTCPDSQSFARNEGNSVMGKDVKEEQNRLRGFETHRMWSPVEECSVGSRDSLSESSCSKLDNVSEKQDRKSCIGQRAQTTPVSSQDCLRPKLLKESTASTGTTEEHDCSKQRQDFKIEELLSQVEVLWDALQEKYGENNKLEPAEKEQSRDKAAQMVSDLTVSNHLSENVEECSSGMLEKFLELLDHSGCHKLSQDVPGSLHRQEMAEGAEMSLNLPSHQSEQERPQKQDQITNDLQSSLSTLTLRINQHLCRCAELSMDLLDIETEMAVLCDPELSGLEGLQEQQDDLEAHHNIIEGEVREVERLASQLQVHPPEQRDPLREEVQAILQAWEEVGRNMVENRGRLEKFHQIRDYFENYIPMITWTENTRSCILAGSSAWRESEVAEIEHGIETKLDEFSKLAAAAQMLMQDESQFKDIIKERTDELQSMLGWIQVNWHAQREQLIRNQNGRPEDLVQQQAMPVKIPSNSQCIVNGEVKGSATETQPSQNNFEQQSGRHDVSGFVSQESCLSKTPLGSSICLILSFDEQSSGINQVTKQWSPSNNEILEESASSIQGNRCQSQDKKSMQMQEPQEMLQLRCPDELVTSKETKQMSSCLNLAQLQIKNQGEPDQSLSKEEIASQLSKFNIESSICNHLPENLHHSNKQTYLQLSPDIDNMQNPEHQSQKPQSQIYSQNLMQKSSHNNLEINQNQSDDHLRHEVPTEITHRVFTYLHVSDNYKSTGRVLEVESSTHAAGRGVRTSASGSSLVQSFSSLWQNVYSHNGFKPSSLFKLKEPIRCKEEIQRRSSLHGTVGSEKSGKPSSIFRRRCNTWPEGERRAKESQSNSKLQVFIKKNMLPVNSVISNKTDSFPEDNFPNAGKTSSGPVKNTCSYLSLGSTLSFNLPKCFHNSVLNMENKQEIQPAQIYDDSNNQTLPSAGTPQSEMEVEPVIHTKQTEINLHIEDLGSTEEPTTEPETQQLNQVYESMGPVLRVFTSVEYEEPDNVSSSHHEASSPVVNGSTSVTHCRHLCPSSSGGHNCLSVYTKIKDLNGHLYYTSKHKKTNLFPNSPVSRKSGRIINCGVRDCAVCFSDTLKETIVDCAEKPDVSMEELLKPGHWLFQQEEEELEDIWRGRVGNLTSNCTVETNTEEEKGEDSYNKG
ncbi:putative leucine-rich repeat-containing protein DDB_G0290503 isoform X2 [Carassius gibelio]|nr:putative leucine-rich repeat-containing protein DDB_G0290503 isoform X2 [Carassius gibelio]